MRSLQEEVSRLNLRISELHSKNAALRHENEILKRGKPMYSEENERLAEAAYNHWLFAHPNDPTWEQFPSKYVWRDLVEAYQRKPDVRGAIPEIEQCVVLAIASDTAGKLRAAVASQEPIPEPVVEPVELKPAKAIKKK